MCIAEVECKQARAECQQAPDAALSAGGGVKHAVHSQLSPWRPVTLSDPRPRASVAHHLPVASVDHVARAARHQQVRKVFAPAQQYSHFAHGCESRLCTDGHCLPAPDWSVVCDQPLVDRSDSAAAGGRMSATYALGALLAIALGGYLLYALIRPEKF